MKQIAITLSDEIYEAVLKQKDSIYHALECTKKTKMPPQLSCLLKVAIIQGTELEPHGKLIDADELQTDVMFDDDGHGSWQKDDGYSTTQIKNAKTVLEPFVDTEREKDEAEMDEPDR